MGSGSSQHCTELEFLSQKNKEDFIQTLCQCPNENKYELSKDILSKYKDAKNFVLLTKGKSTQPKLWQSENIFVCAISQPNPPLNLKSYAYNEYHNLPFISIHLDPITYFYMCYFMNKVRFYIDREEFLKRIILTTQMIEDKNGSLLDFIEDSSQPKEIIYPSASIATDFSQTIPIINELPPQNNISTSLISNNSRKNQQSSQLSVETSSFLPKVSSPGDTDISGMAQRSKKRITGFPAAPHTLSDDDDDFDDYNSYEPSLDEPNHLEEHLSSSHKNRQLHDDEEIVLNSTTKTQRIRLSSASISSHYSQQSHGLTKSINHTLKTRSSKPSKSNNQASISKKKNLSNKTQLVEEPIRPKTTVSKQQNLSNKNNQAEEPIKQKAISKTKVTPSKQRTSKTPVSRTTVTKLKTPPNNMNNNNDYNNKQVEEPIKQKMAVSKPKQAASELKISQNNQQIEEPIRQKTIASKSKTSPTHNQQVKEPLKPRNQAPQTSRKTLPKKTTNKVNTQRKPQRTKK